MSTAGQRDEDGHLRPLTNGLLLPRLNRRLPAVDKHANEPAKAVILSKQMTVKVFGLGGDSLKRLAHRRRLQGDPRPSIDELAKRGRHDNGDATQRVISSELPRVLDAI
jgi:hypothetical protein